MYTLSLCVSVPFVCAQRFVLSKEWWDKWCRYTGYNEDDTVDGDEEEAAVGAVSAVTGPGHRALRPIKISNRSPLDDDSYFTVLRKELVETMSLYCCRRAPGRSWRNGMAGDRPSSVEWCARTRRRDFECCACG